MRNLLRLAVLSLALTGVALSGCASTHSFDRLEPPHVVFKDEATSIGLIDVVTTSGSYEDNAASGDVVYRGLQDAIGSRLQVKTFDLRRQHHKVTWNIPDFFDKLKAQLTFSPESKPSPTLEVSSADVAASPLLVSANIPVWQNGLLLMGVSLWTRGAKELSTSWVTARIDSTTHRLSIQVDNQDVIAAGGITGSSYERSEDGWDARSIPPSDATQLSLFQLKHAFGAVLFPYLSHKRTDQMIFVKEPSSLEPGILLAKQGSYADAYTAFMKVAEAEPRNHGALSNASQMKWAMGDMKAAAELMKKANAIESTPLSRQRQEMFEREQQQSKVIDATAPAPAPAPAPN